MLSSFRRRLPAGVILASLVGALVVAAGLPATAHYPSVPDDPHTYTDPHAGVVAPPRAPGRLAPVSGALLGVHPDDRHTGTLTAKDQHILATEESTGRRMDINNSYYEFVAIANNWNPAKAAVPFDAANPATYDGRGLSRLAWWDVSLGRIPLVGWACMNSANINSGQYDDVIRKTGEAFKALGNDFFMRYCWEMDGSKRIKDEDDVDNDGNRSELHVGKPADFIRAWNRIYDIIAAPAVPMVHEVPLKVERVGAKNVVWVWCGNAAHFKNVNDGAQDGLGQSYHAWDYYPGDATVDWISADGYNWALSKRNKESNYQRDRWRGFIEIFDEFMTWARSTGAIPASMVDEIQRDDPDFAQTVFPNKTQMKPIMIGEYGAIEQSETEQQDGRAEHYTNIAPHLTKPDWLKESHDAVNGTKVATGACHWCGIYSDIAAMVYFDINADGSDQNGDWRINSTQASRDAYRTSAAQDPWFKQIHNIGWPASANSNYTSTGQPPPVQQPPVQQPPVQQPPVQQPPGQQPPVQQPPLQQPGAGRSGYWMLGSDGKVYPFGDAVGHGDAVSSTAVDVEPTPSDAGYWIIDSAGRVSIHGDAGFYGSVNAGRLVTGETVTSLSSTPSGKGYWIFTSRGRVLNFGDAVHLGDVSAIKLNGPVLDSIPTPSGNGYYMVASDGGIFSFGDAVFYGSMGAVKLNAPVQSLVPDPDGKGYWLVAADGGVFAFETAFRGSMGDKRLNKPVTGMVPYGNGYLMVAEDGGIFNFSDRPFSGSLGGIPPAKPIVAVAAL
jgi:hypothetical protein